MSLCITDLDLQLPPVTLWRVQIGNVTAWVAVCMCGYRSRPARLISNCVGETHDHSRRTHVALTPAEVIIAAAKKRKPAA